MPLDIERARRRVESFPALPGVKRDEIKQGEARESKLGEFIGGRERERERRREEEGKRV